MIGKLTRYEHLRESISHRMIGDDRALPRRNRLCPRLCRFSTPARVGDGRSPSTTRGVQKETTAAFTGQHRPTLLGYAPAMVVRLGWCLDHRKSRDSGLVAPRRFPAVLASALPATRAAKINDKIRGLIRRM